jgi:hypothetical protein
VVSGGRTVDPLERELNAHEAHASATAAALLLFLWGAVSVFVVPPQFRVVDATHTIVGAIASAWFILTRRRPHTRFSYAFIAIVLIDTLTVLPWITMQWCVVGRPFEALNVPQVGLLTVPLVIPRSFGLGVAAMLAFLVEALFVTMYAMHIGMEARLPIGEPQITTFLVMPALGLLVLRERRRRVARRHIQLQAESQALARLSPLFARLRSEVTTQLAVLAGELGAVTASPASASMGRSVDRLLIVDAKLGDLTDEALPPALDGGDTVHPVPTDAEHAFLAADEQFGAIFFALVTLLLAVFSLPVGYRVLGASFAVSLTACAVAAAIVFVWLITTQRRPSRRRGRAAVMLLCLIILIAVSLNQLTFLAVPEPFMPFMGHKILMVMLGLTAASWFWLGLPIIVLTAADAVVLFYVLHFDHLRDRVSVVEPWTTLVFMAIGVVALLLRDQRRIASLALLRAESHVWGLHRRAMMLLALRDQLNTPLQTLVVGASRLALQNPSRDVSRMEAAIARLVVLSRELAQLDIPTEAQLASMDSQALFPTQHS